MVYENQKIKLELVSLDTVDLLINWTLDTVAQGKYKTVPNMDREQLRVLFLEGNNRRYYLIKTKDDQPIGRFYYRKWIFNKNKNLVDWELNLIIANPSFRGRGLGTEVQKLAVEILAGLKETNSIFAYTMEENIGERRALEKCGFDFQGNLHNQYYRIDLGDLNPNEFVLYSKLINID